MTPLPLYWLRTWNFGDILNPILYKHITGRDAVYSETSPKITALGSVMSMVKPGDVVWGTGCISEDTPLSCDSTTDIRALRGPFSAKVLRSRGVKVPANLPFGSPANLLPAFIPGAKSQIYECGFLPHYIDYGQIDPATLPVHVLLLSPSTEPIQLIEQITSCKYIVSSSLHGIIVAEAYGIPAVWVELSDNVVGKGFKFRDYYAGSGRKIDPLNWRSGMNWRDAFNQAYRAGVYSGYMDYNSRELMDVCPFGRDE